MNFLSWTTLDLPIFSPRSGHCMEVTEKFMIIFGGIDEDSRLNDLYFLDLSNLLSMNFI